MPKSVEQAAADRAFDGWLRHNAPGFLERLEWEQNRTAVRETELAIEKIFQKVAEELVDGQHAS